MDTKPAAVKIGELIPSGRHEDDGIDWNVIETKQIANVPKEIVKISFYEKKGQPKVFIGFSDDTAIATASGPVMDQMAKLRNALEMHEDEMFTPYPVEATLTEIKGRSGRTYYVFQ